jgi:hypothetical protein
MAAKLLKVLFGLIESVDFDNPRLVTENDLFLSGGDCYVSDEVL